MDKTSELVTRLLDDAKSLEQQDAELLARIRQIYPFANQRRYDQLQRKWRAETISEAEYEELMGIVNQHEQAAADLLETMMALAQVRGQNYWELRATLDGLPPHWEGTGNKKPARKTRR